MKKSGIRALGLTCSASMVALVLAQPAFAQDAQDVTGAPEASDPIEEDSAATQVDAEGEPAEEGAIVVTGSRIQRTTSYTSISPLQVLDTETLQDTGQFDAASILQQTESAAGTQIDATFQGFVLNNGPGSQTLDLRGLGADRTLLLVNGRRLAPAGVEGAPTNPSINLIPSSLVARYDLLLDGASSVYGSDAVAGVGNIVLRKDLDGLELFLSGNKNEQSNGGDDYQISAAWGKRGTNWQFGIGAEYSKRDEVKLGDRDFLSGCNTHYEIDQDGNIRTVGISDDANTRRLSNGAISEVTTACKIEVAAKRIIPSSSPGIAGSGLFFSSIYYDPTVYPTTGRAGNTGIPGFTDAFDAFGRPVDRNGDGLLDVDFTQVTRNGNDLAVSFISPQDLYNVMAYGEYEFGGEWNITPFFEANYSRADVSARSNVPQLFPVVGSRNPFNPCNISTVNGVRVNPNAVDCGVAQNTFDNLAVTSPANQRVPGRLYTVQPVVNVVGDRSFVETRQEQYRGVFGVKGDLPFINFGPANDWTFEVAGVHSYSKGTSSRIGIRADKLALALGLDPTVASPTRQATPVQLPGGPCTTTGFSNPNNAQPDLLQGCVPVNLFAPSLYENVVGDFASQAERDYVFDSRDFDTRYKQTLLSAYLQGSIFSLQGGDAKAVIGAEWRKDTLKSIPDAVAAEGLFFGFFADQGAVGSKTIKELFGEVDLPLVSGQPAAQQVNLNLSGRITKDEFYGTNETYSIKFGWRPIEPLLLKIAYGTSFRAPNLRENFLAGQSGFGGVTDPCAVPTAAYAPLGGGYNASLDTRDPVILANCIREGRDPTRVGIDGPNGPNTVQVPSVEITSGGSFDLDPETSTSLTTGFSFQENVGPLDFAFNFNYYRIKVKGAIAEPTAQFIVNQCFVRDDPNRSSFCDFIGYQTDPNSRLLISDVFAGFVNINSEIVRGIDLNADFGTTVPLGSKDLRLGLNLRANHLIQRDSIFLDSNGNPTLDEDAGEFGFPSWTGRATFTARVDPITFTWSTRMIGKTEQQEDGIDLLSDAFGFGPDGQPTGFVGNTCLGGGSRTNGVPNGIVPGDGVYCRDVGFAKTYFVSTASLRYSGEWFDVRVGVSNVFDKKPPRIDTDEVFGVANTPIGNGYDLNGREFFASTTIKF